MEKESIDKLKSGYVYFKNEIINLEREKQIRNNEISEIDNAMNRLYYELSIIVQHMENKDIDFTNFLETIKDI